MTVPVERLLDGADDLLAGGGPRGAWPRAAALLTRTALEQAVAARWAAAGVDVQGVALSAQVLALRHLVDPARAETVAALWAGLSRGCHHHAYELAPTVGELRGWVDETRRAVADL